MASHRIRFAETKVNLVFSNAKCALSAPILAYLVVNGAIYDSISNPEIIGKN